jgi:hypothetical protein
MLRFVIASALAVSAWYLIRDPLIVAEAGAANLVLRHSPFRDATILVEESCMQLSVYPNSTNENSDTPRTYSKRNKYGTTWSSIFYVGALLCIPFRIVRRRWTHLIAAAVMLFIAQTASLLFLVITHPAIYTMGHEIRVYGPGAVMFRRFGFFLFMNALVVLPILFLLPLCGDLIRNGAPQDKKTKAL